MRGDEFLDKMEYLDPDLIEEADLLPVRKRRKSTMRWITMAACFCLVAFGAYQATTWQKSANDMAGTMSETETADIAAEEYSDEYAAADQLVMIDGTLYANTGESIEISEDIPVSGTITSQTDGTPDTDDQSNFGTGYSYILDEDQLYVQIDGCWYVFAER